MPAFSGFFPQQESYYDGADPWDTPFLPGGAQDSSPYIGGAVAPIQAQQEDSGFNFLPGSVGNSIYDAASATGVRPGFALGVAHNESQSFNPYDKTTGWNGEDVTSRGLFGMTDAAVTDANQYATQHMQPLGNPDRTDPLGESLRGTNYLRMMLDRNNGNESEAAYDFNQGMGAPEDRPAGDVYANNALNFLPGGKIQTASLNATGPSGGFGSNASGGGGSDTAPSVNQGANERIKMITALQSQASDYKKKALESQKEAYAPSKLSRGDVFGTVGVPLIATLIGAAMNGKKGAKGGAIAGLQGAGVGLKVSEGEAAKKSQLAAEQAKYYLGEAKDVQNQAQQLQSQEFNAQDLDKRYGAGGNRPANQPLTQGDYEYWGPKLGMAPDQLAKTATTNGDIDRMLREKGIVQSSINLRDRQTFSKERGKAFGVEPLPGYENLSDIQKKNAGDIKAYTNSMLGALGDLRKSYQETGQVFIGADRAEQQANASVLWSAARNLLKTGMRLEGKEQELVNALATPQFDLDGITGVLKNEFLKDGADETAARLENVIKRDAASKLEANSQYAPEYLQFHSPAVLAALGDKKKTGAVTPPTTPTPPAGSAVPNKPGYLFDGTIGANGRPNIYKAQ